MSYFKENQEAILRRRWLRIGAENGTEWDSFEQFAAWHAEKAVSDDYLLRRSNPNKPHGPDNSYLVRKNPNGDDDEMPISDFCESCGSNCGDDRHGCAAWRKNFISYWDKYIHRTIPDST